MQSFKTSSDLAKEISVQNEQKIQAKQEASSTIDSIVRTEHGREALSALISSSGPLGRRIGREVNRVLSGKTPSLWLARQTSEGAIKKISTQLSVDSSQSTVPFVKIGNTIPSAQLQNSKIEKEWGFKHIEPPVVPCGLGLYVKGDHVWIRAGTIDNELLDGFDAIDGKFIASSGNQYVVAMVTIDESNGEIENIDIISSNNIPQDTTTTFYTAIGRYEYRFVNSAEVPYVTTYGCGNISVLVCRNWYTTEPPLYTVIFSR